MMSVNQDRREEFDPYCIAVKRESRATAPEGWVEMLRKIEGVEITAEGQGKSPIVAFNATIDGMRAVERELGSFCHIECAIRHEPIATREEMLLPPVPR